MNTGVRIAADEQETIDWCCLALTDEQIAECEAEAAEIAAVELHHEEAYEKLKETLARIIVRNDRAQQNANADESR